MVLIHNIINKVISENLDLLTLLHKIGQFARTPCNVHENNDQAKILSLPVFLAYKLKIIFYKIKKLPNATGYKLLILKYGNISSYVTSLLL